MVMWMSGILGYRSVVFLVLGWFLFLFPFSLFPFSHTILTSCLGYTFLFSTFRSIFFLIFLRYLENEYWAKK